MPNRNNEHDIRERAYFIWEQEGRPGDRAHDHWQRAAVEHQDSPDESLMQDEEKILAGRSDVNYPALLTRDVPGG
jgi:hypothetical protein